MLAEYNAPRPAIGTSSRNRAVAYCFVRAVAVPTAEAFELERHPGLEPDNLTVWKTGAQTRWAMQLSAG